MCIGHECQPWSWLKMDITVLSKLLGKNYDATFIHNYVRQGTKWRVNIFKYKLQVM